MLLLRIGKQWKWTGAADDPQAIQVAASDLTLRENEVGLSVFSVNMPEDSRELAVRHALTNQRTAKPIDFVAFPESLVGELGLAVVAVSDDRLDPTLSEHHREIRGLTPELTERLAAAILASPDRQVERIAKGEITQLGGTLCRADFELRSRLQPDWQARLAPLLD